MTLGTYAQDFPCGTVAPQKTKNLETFSAQLLRSQGRRSLEPHFMGITAQVLQRDDGSGGLSQSQLQDAINQLNEYYENIQIEFFIIAQNNIANSTYFDLHTDAQYILAERYDIPNTINVYFANTLLDANANEICGETALPGGDERILVQNACVIGGNTLTHEVGHFLSLIHTHGDANHPLEYVDGSNCESAGDEICDTPADPNLNGLVNDACGYIGTYIDPNGDAYAPSTINMMSYAPQSCRVQFTRQQYDRMLAAYTAYRTNIYEQREVSIIDAQAREICEGGQVQFLDASLGASTYFWQFPGGNPAFSTSPNPLVRYDSVGSYDVKLTITGTRGIKDSSTYEAFVQVVSADPPMITKRAETFENAVSTVIENPDNDLTFENSSGYASEGDKCMVMRFFDYQNIGRKDYLKLGRVNTEVNKEIAVSFHLAHAYFSDSYPDGLEVVYKIDCETDWQVAWQAFGEDLATAGAQSDYYTPSSEDWQPREVSFSVAEDVNMVQVALRTVNGYGNNLWLDNYEVRSGSVEDFGDVVVTTIPTTCHDSATGVVNVSQTGTGTYDYSLDQASYVPEGSFDSLPAGEHLLFIRKNGTELLAESFVIAQPKALMLDFEVDVSACETGDVFEIRASGEGGVGDYTYDLQGVDSNTSGVYEKVSPGNYILEIKDENECATLEELIIEGFQPLEVSYTVQDNTCYEGSEGAIILDAAGGQGALTYVLNNQILGDSSRYDGLIAGIYDLVVLDENFCNAALTIPVLQPDEITIEVAYMVADCQYEEVGMEVQAGGGLGDVLVSLDSGTTWISEGVFTNDVKEDVLILARDSAGCVNDRLVEVPRLGSLNVAIEVLNAVCEAGTGEVHLSIQGGQQPYSMFLNGEKITDQVQRDLPPGAYTLLVEDANLCAFRDTVDLGFQYEQPEQPELLLDTNQLVVTDFSFDIAWYLNDRLLAGEVNDTLADPIDGYYRVSYSHGGYCEVFSDVVVVGDPSALATEITFGPNPVDERMFFYVPEKLRTSVSKIIISDLSGKQLIVQDFADEINLTVPVGLYTVTIVGPGCLESFRFVKQ